MKKILVLIFFAAFLSHAATGNSFDIHVSIKNLRAPARLILTVRDVGQWTEYTAESANGSFQLKGTLKDPAFAFLVMKYQSDLDKAPDMNNVTELFIEPGTIRIEGDGSLKTAIITAGPAQRKLQEIKQQVNAYQADQYADRANAVKKFVESNPQSFVSIYLLQDFHLDGSFRMEAGNVAPLFELLAPQLKESASGQELKNDITVAQRTAIGSTAPDFVQADTVGRQVTLKSLRGHYVLIDFWASWCKPCRAENPSLVKAYQSWKDKGFTILGVSLDNNKNSWLKAIRKDGLTWTQVSDLKFWRNEVAMQYGVKTIPQNFLLDPEGKIIGRNIPPKDLSAWLSQHIK